MYIRAHIYIYIGIYIYIVFLYQFTFPLHAQTPVKTLKPKFPSPACHISEGSDDNENDNDLDDELSGTDTSEDGDLDDAKQQARDPNAVDECSPGKCYVV